MFKLLWNRETVNKHVWFYEGTKYGVLCVHMLTAEWDAQRRARLESDMGSEDAVAMRLRRAEEEKQRKLREFEEKARTRSEDVGAREAALRERHANADLAKQQALQQMHEMNRAKAAAYNQGIYSHSSPLVSSPLFASESVSHAVEWGV